MSRPSRFAGRGKRDANHVILSVCYARHGYEVQDLSSVGGDCADVLLRRPDGVLIVREFKTPKGIVKPGQAAWLERWGGKVIRSVDEALADIQAQD